MICSATYSPDDNKLRLYASSRLDADTYARVRAAGFIWAAKQDLFVAPMWTPDREDLLIDLCGEIGDEDTSLVDRAEERADRFEGYHDKRLSEAEQARAAVSAIADNIPLGQPILVGHHSERRARRDAEKIQNGMRKAIKLWDTSKYWQSRAAGALAHAKYKERPGVRARRIKTIEADKRKSERNIATAREALRLWGALDTPGKEGRPCDDELRQRRALLIADTHGAYLPKDDPRGWSVWSALDKGAMTPHEAQQWCRTAYERTIAINERWIAHYDHRLAYERAMLAEQGASHLIKKRPPRKSAKAQLPLLNYRAPEGITCQNLYRRGETIHHPQIDMTTAEYAQISSDYKATRVAVDGTHRVRTTMRRHALVSVFLTDSKVHERPAPPPAPEPDPEPEAPAPRAEDEQAAHRAEDPHCTCNDCLVDHEAQLVEDDGCPPPPPKPVPFYEQGPEGFEAMRASLKAGVQVISAPQLFPTPPELAERMVRLAEIPLLGARMLEPSAGTGAILTALGTRGGPVPIAIEINHQLAEQLRQRFPLARVVCRDFLQCNGDLGTFDRILMNPPFENGIDVKHIEHARSMLAPGGLLVALCANGPRQQAALQPIAEYWEDLPAGTFAGTDVRAALLVVRA